MVEYHLNLNNVFSSLADETRRDILKKIGKKSLSVSEIAKHYQITFAAVAKHLNVLHRAQLISKSRRGKQQIVSISPQTLAATSNYLESYKELWENRLDSLDVYLKKINEIRLR